MCGLLFFLCFRCYWSQLSGDLANLVVCTFLDSTSKNSSVVLGRLVQNLHQQFFRQVQVLAIWLVWTCQRCIVPSRCRSRRSWGTPPVAPQWPAKRQDTDHWRFCILLVCTLESEHLKQCPEVTTQASSSSFQRKSTRCTTIASVCNKEEQEDKIAPANL